jgi:transglutaminase-like putative cysteine protease
MPERDFAPATACNAGPNDGCLGGGWYTFDARHNKPRIGRILMARGRDATDVAIVTSFGLCTLAGFKVITEEVTSASPANP